MADGRSTEEKCGHDSRYNRYIETTIGRERNKDLFFLGVFVFVSISPPHCRMPRDPHAHLHPSSPHPLCCAIAPALVMPPLLPSPLLRGDPVDFDGASHRSFFVPWALPIPVRGCIV